ncbi:50S ribosomal protein L22 [Candidatus Falkowbacteria bacterium]|nr:50S ribosomal protein L22 [Candidatus Falkowbacteria bacterium]
MFIKGKVKYIRISPRKVRLVVDAVRGLDLTVAMDKLALINKQAVKPVIKLLKSVLANAEHNFELEKSNLYLKEICVDDGPTAYRWMPRAHGRATPIRKRTSIISVVFDEKVPSKTKKKGKAEKIKTVKVDEKYSEAIEEKLEDKVKTGVKADAKDGHAVEPTDPRRVGGYRDMQQRPVKIGKPRGWFKKMFRRMAGE